MCAVALSLTPQPYCHWNLEGNGFCIPDVIAFERHVLPIYYKHRRVGAVWAIARSSHTHFAHARQRFVLHIRTAATPFLICSRYSSFLRSLSYYSFNKVSQGDHPVEYTHHVFRRGHPDCLAQVRSTVSIATAPHMGVCASPTCVAFSQPLFSKRSSWMLLFGARAHPP